MIQEKNGCEGDFENPKEAILCPSSNALVS